MGDSNPRYRRERAASTSSSASSPLSRSVVRSSSRAASCMGSRFVTPCSRTLAVISSRRLNVRGASEIPDGEVLVANYQSDLSLARGPQRTGLREVHVRGNPGLTRPIEQCHERRALVSPRAPPYENDEPGMR